MDTLSTVRYVEHSASDSGTCLVRTAEYRVGRLSDVHARLTCFPDIVQQAKALSLVEWAKGLVLPRGGE